MLDGVKVWMVLLALLIWGIASLLPVQRGGVTASALISSSGAMPLASSRGRDTGGCARS